MKPGPNIASKQAKRHGTEVFAAPDGGKYLVTPQKAGEHKGKFCVRRQTKQYVKNQKLNGGRYSGLPCRVGYARTKPAAYALIQASKERLAKRAKS